MDQKIHTAINKLDREEVVAILTEHGFACYDPEPTEDLLEALRVNIDDGTISSEEVNDMIRSRA